MRIGILGAGVIAGKIAATLLPLRPDMLYAVAARDLDRAEAFRERYSMQIAYGSYLELVTDPLVDIVYVTTPHSHHYEHARLAIEYGKAVICEKAFTATADEAAELICLAQERGVFLMEAMWTRFMPLSHTIADVLNSGIIGNPRLLSGTLCYQMTTKERILRPELCGGALLDLGVYCLHFARMYFGDQITDVHSHAVLHPNGVDWINAISLVYKDGRVANLQSAACCYNDRQGVISCDRGYLVIDNINCPTHVSVFDHQYTLIAEYAAPDAQVSGYEYEFLACEEALANGWLEHPLMPHTETLAIMRMMDDLRAHWGVRFPMDK